MRRVAYSLMLAAVSTAAPVILAGASPIEQWVQPVPIRPVCHHMFSCARTTEIVRSQPITPPREMVARSPSPSIRHGRHG